jgi:CheY-like chemotaxis protein
LIPGKILIVEDSCELREMLRAALAARGWNPIVAENGRKALHKLEHETPGVILMDMHMPDMNGFELAAILKKHGVYRNIPILAATGYPDSVAREQCLLAGCDDFISKPFPVSALETCLNNLMSLTKSK